VRWCMVVSTRVVSTRSFRPRVTFACLVPVIGARTRTQLADSVGALGVQLSPEEIARIEAAIPADAVAGTRYDERQMRMLDSKR
jgi:hypothetical protein